MFIVVNQSTIKVSVTHVYGMFHRMIRCAFRSLTAHHLYLSHIRYTALTEYNLNVRYDIDVSAWRFSPYGGLRTSPDPWGAFGCHRSEGWSDSLRSASLESWPMIWCGTSVPSYHVYGWPIWYLWSKRNPTRIQSYGITENQSCYVKWNKISEVKANKHQKAEV